MTKYLKPGLLALGLSVALPALQAGAETVDRQAGASVISGITRTIVVATMTNSNSTVAEGPGFHSYH